MEIKWLDGAIVFLYLVGMIAVGLWSTRKVRTLLDYSLAGRSLGYPVMIGTLVGAAIGAAATVGKAGKAYQVGIFLFVATLGYGIGLILFGFLSKKLREIELWTIPDALQMRYGQGMRVVMAGVMVLAVIALFGAQIIGMGLIFSSVGRSLGLTYQSAIIIAGGILIFYTMVGGLFAVAYTDLVQSLIMFVGIGLILPAVVVGKASSMGNIWDMLKPPPAGLLGGMSVLYFISIFLIDIPFSLVDPSLWQRANAARDEKVIKRSMFVTAGIYFYWSLACVVMGVLGARLIPDVVQRFGTADAVIPAMVISYLPTIIVGFCLAGLMAVMMSTASVALLISGTTVSNDLVKAFRPQSSEGTLLLWAKGTVLVIGILGIIFALFMKGIFDILLLAFAIYISGVFFPTMAALYWEKATKPAAIISSIVATVVVVGLYAMNKPFGIEPIVVSLFVSLVLMVGISLLTYRHERATPRLFAKTK